jgi:uncharacterized protein YbjT (DUF2867 family)
MTTNDITEDIINTKKGSQHLDKVYDITGPEALSHNQVAEILSEVTGRSISYMDIPEEDARKGMKDRYERLVYSECDGVI